MATAGAESAVYDCLVVFRGNQESDLLCVMSNGDRLVTVHCRHITAAADADDDDRCSDDHGADAVKLIIQPHVSLMNGRI